jgi:predicted DCC family thiol-disulfide oxidoreductase YuxK
MAEITVWYDGVCPLCLREIALMKRLDTRHAITFVDVADAKAEAACPLDRRLLLQRFHALDNGQLLSGAAAFAAMWRAIPRLRFLGLLAKSPIVLAGLEWLYLRFLKVRPTLQRAVIKLESKR